MLSEIVLKKEQRRSHLSEIVLKKEQLTSHLSEIVLKKEQLTSHLSEIVLVVCVAGLSGLGSDPAELVDLTLPGTERLSHTDSGKASLALPLSCCSCC